MNLNEQIQKLQEARNTAKTLDEWEALNKQIITLQKELLWQTKR